MASGKFPKPYRIGENSVRWKSNEISDCIDSLLIAEPTQVAPGARRGRKPKAISKEAQTMSSKRVYEIEGIDLASFLVTAGHEATIYRNLEGKRAVFSFPENDQLHEAIIAYERGASLPAKKLLNTRSWLFREASRVVSGGA
jgi:hypothetical protein